MSVPGKNSNLSVLLRAVTADGMKDFFDFLTLTLTPAQWASVLSPWWQPEGVVEVVKGVLSKEGDFCWPDLLFGFLFCA